MRKHLCSKFFTILKFKIMKNLPFWPFVLFLATMIALTCQKAPSLPLEGVSENSTNQEASYRDDECFSCELTMYVEVVDWSTVTYIRIFYPNPANPNSPLWKIFTQYTAASFTVCADPGDVTIQIFGGPAAAHVKAINATGLDRVIYLVNTGTGNVSCTSELKDTCNELVPWDTGGTCGISQG